MVGMIRFTLGLLIMMSAFPHSLGAQEFLKQLEDRLKDAAKPAQKKENAEKLTEELPLPNQKQQASSDGSESKPPSSPLVFPPKKSRNPDASTVPMANPSAEPDVQGTGYLGLTVEPLARGNFGLAVVEVTPQSPAWKSGFRVGDRVIGLGGEAVTTIDQFAAALQAYPPGEPIKFLVQRQGRSVTLTAILQNRDVAQRVQGNVPGKATRRPSTPYQPLSEPVASNEGMTLGVSVSNLSEAFRQQFGIPVFRGAAVSEVVVGSPAERAGIQPGDCIVDIDGRMILFAEDVVNAMRSAVSGETITIGYYRGLRKMLTQIPVLLEEETGTGRRIAGRGFSEETDREMLTPEYVAALQAEIVRLNEELEAMRLRLQDLESRLPSDRR